MSKVKLDEEKVTEAMQKLAELTTRDDFNSNPDSISEAQTQILNDVFGEQNRLLFNFKAAMRETTSINWNVILPAHAPKLAQICKDFIDGGSAETGDGAASTAPPKKAAKKTAAAPDKPKKTPKKPTETVEKKEEETETEVEAETPKPATARRTFRPKKAAADKPEVETPTPAKTPKVTASVGNTDDTENTLAQLLSKMTEIETTVAFVQEHVDGRMDNVENMLQQLWTEIRALILDPDRVPPENLG